MKKADEICAQAIFSEVTETITKPWIEKIKRRPPFRSPHRNSYLHRLCKQTMKAKKITWSSDLEADWELYREKRRKRRAFSKRNEDHLRCGSNNPLADAIDEDKKKGD